MLDTEGQWSEAIASNNIRAIIRWLREFTAEGKADVEEILMTFIVWVQRTSEFAKRELLTLCFSRCQGLWMFLDRSSFNRVHVLLQRLRNLLTLAQWARRQLGSAHLWHGTGVPCVVCRDTFGSSDIRRGCWNRERRALKQHIWLGRLVQWWGITGLLPKYPEAPEVKLISQMWKEMDHSHRKASLETPGSKEGEMERCRSLIQGMVTELGRQHGCIWTSEGGTDERYPPPNLQALLKLVLVPNIDNISVQALLMYFVLDMAKFLQCKDDLLQSFCHAFTISSSFSQQIRAFWMLDHGQIKGSMELLLSPRAAAPRLSWQHRCIIHCLLKRKQPQIALRYLHWTGLALESLEDAKLCTDVLLQNSCVSGAWALLKRSHTNSDNMVMYFLQACNGLGLSAEAIKCLPAGYNDEGDIENGTTRSQLPLAKKDLSAGRPPCPLSAKLYQAHRVHSVSPEELVQLLRTAALEVRKPRPEISEVVWPEHRARKWKSREMFPSTQALHHLTPSPSPMHRVEETEQTPHADEPGEERPVHNDLSSASCLPLLRQDHPYVYAHTLTLQRMSSLLMDEENQSEEEEEVEEESKTPSSVDALPDCPEQTMTLDGATDPAFVCNLNKDIVIELVLSAEEKMPCCQGEDIIHGAPDVTDLRSSALPLNQEEQSDCIPAHISSFSFSEGLSCASETTQDLPTTDLHRSPLSEDPVASRSRVSAGTGQQDISLLTTVCSAIFPTQRQISGSSLTPRLTCNIITPSAPSGTADENSPEAQLKVDEPCAQSASTLLDHCKTATWWKQELETCRASTGLPPAPQPAATITSDNKRPSLVLGQPYSYGPVHFRDFTAKQKGDSRNGKQTDKEEPAGWTSLGTGSQGAIRSGRTLLRKGKRGKRA